MTKMVSFSVFSCCGCECGSLFFFPDMPDLEPPEPVPESEPEPEPEEQEEPEPVDPDVIPAESDPPQPTGDLNAEVREQ